MALTEIKYATLHYFCDEYERYQGEYKRWYDNGQPQELCYFVDGELHGEYRWWFSNGNISNHENYIHGKLHGLITQWYEDGLVMKCGYYVDRLRHGEFKFWDTDGCLQYYYLYNKGVKLDIDPSKLTEEDRLILTLKYGFQWL